MRIGIITEPLRSNYGGVLQNFALQVTLKKLGHKPVTLDPPVSTKPQVSVVRRALSIAKQLIKRHLLGRRNAIVDLYGYDAKQRSIAHANIASFISEHISIKEFIGTNIAETDFDALIVGSDQVWRGWGGKMNADRFLAFAENWAEVKRIAYAVSFGVDQWTINKEETPRCVALAQKFDAISVREDSGIDICHGIGCKAIKVLDPTLLLDATDYTAVLEGKTNFTPRHGGVLCYVLDESPAKGQIAKSVAAHLGTSNVHHASAQSADPSVYFEWRVQPPVEQWLADFSEADFVVTDSFHGCTFSIVFNKPFIAIGNAARGLSRFKSLLGQFGLMDRLVVNDSSDISNIVATPIDWQAVNETRDQLKVQSIQFLTQSLAK